MKTLQVGDLAPQFTLLNQDNQPISLSDFKGKKKYLCIFIQKP